MNPSNQDTGRQSTRLYWSDQDPFFLEGGELDVDPAKLTPDQLYRLLASALREAESEEGIRPGGR